MLTHRWLAPWAALIALNLLASQAAAETLPVFSLKQLLGREVLPMPTGNFNLPLPKYYPDEPKLAAVSFTKAADWLDRTAVHWSQTNSCGKCHINYVYIMARPQLPGANNAAMAQTRQFIEQFGAKSPQEQIGTQMVMKATALAFHDAQFGGKLQPTTRQALAHMWTLQEPLPYGCWHKLGCGWVYPAENDYYTATMMAVLGVSVAPENYAQSVQAKDGLTRLRRQLAKVQPRQLHDKVLLLWAARHLDGLLTSAEQKTIVKELLAQQRADGGWSFHAISQRPHLKLTPRDTASMPSDGYGTALVVYVLRQAGLPATQPEIVRGADWLRTNQRVSGLWFTPSDQAGEQPEEGFGTRELTILNTGTAFAVMALKACQ